MSNVIVGSNPGDGLVHYGPVPRERWTTVQRWDGDAWIDDVTDT